MKLKSMILGKMISKNPEEVKLPDIKQKSQKPLPFNLNAALNSIKKAKNS